MTPYEIVKLDTGEILIVTSIGYVKGDYAFMAESEVSRFIYLLRPGEFAILSTLNEVRVWSRARKKFGTEVVKREV